MIARLLKWMTFFLVLSLGMILTSCAVAEHVDGKEIKENAIQMMECVVNEDSEGLFDLYSKNMKDKCKDKSLKEIQQLFDYIDGSIISYDYEGRGGGQETIHEGKICYCSCYPEFDFTTDTGKTYTIAFSYKYIWSEHPEYEGVDMISICENGDWGEQLVIGKKRSQE